MANLGKVSFSFSKISKKPSLQVQPKETVKKVDKIQFIDSIEDNAVKLVNSEDIEENKPLIIPLQHPNLLIQSVIDTVRSRAENGQRTEEVEEGNGSKRDEQATSEKDGETEAKEPPKEETLDQMAARELLEAATDQHEKKEESNLTVPLANDNYSKEESTMDDYENIPVNDFGLAMLRGMGWDPKKGIGKNGQIVKVAGPTLRPKGLGLGADKSLAAQKPVGKNVGDKEILAKGSKVRVTVGPQKNLYGTVEGFDDDAGRINVHMALSNERISMNECFVQLVTPDEFAKYSKVININAYNNYKEKESDRSDTGRNQTEKMSKNGSTTSRDSKYESEDKRQTSSRLKYDESDDDEHSKRSGRASTSDKSKKHSNKYDSDSDAYKRDRISKTSSSKHKHRSERREQVDDDSKYKSRNKPNKKYRSDSDSSSDDKYKSKNRSKDSKRDKERRRSSSDSDDYERRRKHKKNKKKRNRSRSRSGRK